VPFDDQSTRNKAKAVIVGYNVYLSLCELDDKKTTSLRKQPSLKKLAFLSMYDIFFSGENNCHYHDGMEIKQIVIGVR
jgi:hypothetical protein